MNIFSKILDREYGDDTRIGMPARDGAHMLRRATILSQMTGGRGFMVTPAEPRKDSQGRTRGERRRTAYAAMIAKGAPEFMHSAAKQEAA